MSTLGWIDLALAAGLAAALTLSYKCWRRQRYLDRMLVEQTQEALRMDVTKSYQDLLEEHKKLKAV